MIKPLLARIQQKHRTIAYPKKMPELPERYCGRPVVDAERCPADCRQCLDVCPTNALRQENHTLTIDMGRCLFCAQCAESCPHQAITFSREHRLAARSRQELICGNKLNVPEVFDKNIKQLLGRSLKLRQVSAGGCNACEADINVLSTVVFDLGRFGIQFVASPRHADGLVITGPVPENMHLALKKTYEAVPDPKIVIVVGSCSIAGGPYADHEQVHNGVDKIIPVDLYIPGCPPHPLTILDGLLRLLGKIK